MKSSSMPIGCLVLSAEIAAGQWWNFEIQSYST